MLCKEPHLFNLILTLFNKHPFNCVLDGFQLTAQADGLYYNGKKVFLSGVNIAWDSYGYDFGNGQV